MVRKNKAKGSMAHHGSDKITHSLKEEGSKEKQNIKDYDRAWEDDRILKRASSFLLIKSYSLENVNIFLFH